MDYFSGGGEISQNRYNEKLERLSKVEKEGSLDIVLKPILQRLVKLPFSTHNSCSGHTKIGAPDQLTDSPVLFIADEESGGKKIQESFREELPLLQKNINDRLGAEVVEVKLLPYLMELDEGGWKQLTMEETITHGLTYGVKFEISNREMAKTEGRRILTVIWEEFYKYLGRFDGQDLAVPIFGEQAFVKRDKKI